MDSLNIQQLTQRAANAVSECPPQVAGLIAAMATRIESMAMALNEVMMIADRAPAYMQARQEILDEAAD